MTRRTTIVPQEGIIPTQPRSLKAYKETGLFSADELVQEILEKDRAVAIGGLSLLGDKGHICTAIGLFKTLNKDDPEGADLKGWCLFTNHPDKQYLGFHFLDTTQGKMTELAIPNTMIYFVAEVDPLLVEEDASRKELRAIARFIIPFISDEGPPPGMSLE